MSINIVPVEILVKIFGYLDGSELLTCRKVCMLWKAIIHRYIDEEFWRVQCALKYRHNVSPRRYNLTWRELLNSLDIWEKIDEASIQISVIQSPLTTQYYLLANGMLSCSHNISNRNTGRCNCISYYDISATHNLINRFFTGREFSHYYEDEDVIVYDYYDIVPRRTMVMIYSKVEKKNFHSITIKNNSRFIVRNNCIYYHGHSHVMNRDIYTYSLYRLQYRVRDNPGYTNELLRPSSDFELLDVNYMESEDTTFIVRSTTGPIPTLSYVIIVEEMGAFETVTGVDDIDSVQDLHFLWTSPNLLEWLKRKHLNDPRFVLPDVDTALSHGNIVIIATKTPPIRLNFYRDPYDVNLNLILHEVQPFFSINLNDHIDPDLQDRPDANVKLINVTEIIGGHRMTLLYLSRIVIVNIKNDEEIHLAEELSPACSERYQSSVSEEPSEGFSECSKDNTDINLPGSSGITMFKNIDEASNREEKKDALPKSIKGKGKGKKSTPKIKDNNTIKTETASQSRLKDDNESGTVDDNKPDTVESADRDKKILEGDDDAGTANEPDTKPHCPNLKVNPETLI